MSVERTFNKTVLPGKLETELTAALAGASPEIVVETIFMKSGEGADVAHIIFDRLPTALEDVTIQNTVTAHVPSQLSYKIWDIMKDAKVGWSDPSDIDFDILPLEIDWESGVNDAGEIREIIYYRSASLGVDGSILYSDPILRTTWTYIYDPVHLAIYANELIEWYLEDGTLGEVQKEVHHHYDVMAKIERGRERRGRMVTKMMLPIVYNLIAHQTGVRRAEESDPTYELTVAEQLTEFAKGKAFADLHFVAFQMFQRHDSEQIITDITNDVTTTWLTTAMPLESGTPTFRDYLLTKLAVLPATSYGV